MQQLLPDQPLPDPEILPAMDEAPVEFGPNLAGNEKLSGDVLRHIVRKFFFTYELQQMLLWQTWRRIDDMWRARINPADLDYKQTNEKTAEQKRPSNVDFISAQAQTVEAHKQIKALHDICEQMAWQDGPPGKFKVPECTYEHPLWNPTQQSVDALNELRDLSIDECDVREHYGKNIGQYIRYGHAWILTDFERKLDTVRCVYRLNPMDPAAGMQFQMIAAQYPGQQPEPQPDGSIVYRKKIISKMVTHYRHLNVRDVFIDQLLPCDQIGMQPCPFVRQHITDYNLEANAYHQEDNPFGWLNTVEAIHDQRRHYAFNQSDEQSAREAQQKRHSPANIQPVDSEAAVKQLWTAWPMLRIDEKGNLDTGEGVPCPMCEGKKKVMQPTQEGTFDEMGQFIPTEVEMECPTCGASGKVHPPAVRYVVQAYGGMRTNATVLRIQKLPKEIQDPPLLFAADIAEDDATAIPMSRAEVALIPVYQLCKAENQFQQSKDLTISRGFKKRMDGPAWGLDCNQPGVEIPYESSPDEVERVEANTYDETLTLHPQMVRKEADVQRVFGATDQLLGIVSEGRRPALEIGNAIEAGKNPIILMSDRYGRNMFGKWMDQLRRNVELFGDRDWIRKKTGKTTFGRPQIYTSVASDFFKKSAMIQNGRYLLEAANMNPMLQSAVPPLFNDMAKMMGVDVNVDDGGIKKAQADVMRVVTRILGDGVFVPPVPTENHELMVAGISECLKEISEDPNSYWMKHAPQNVPLLAQRLIMQQQLLVQQQMAQMAAMQAQQGAEEGGGEGGGNKPSKGPRSPKDHGQAQQNQQG